ncbi:MAG: methyltransferase domain-containing protein [Deltaproteobacteria bacterium]|nr:methyltransferase domain-containing protein [Deltaproteobacteria bacterium]
MTQNTLKSLSSFEDGTGGKTFSRLDESNDLIFYGTDRFVRHLDDLALETVVKVVGTLVVEDDPAILDLMAGWDSHIPETLRPLKVVGLGLNENELKGNKIFSDYVIHDLNRFPRLPFPDNTFDVVLNTVSVDYMTKPVHVFKDVGRVLKPGGLFLVIFSNRMFPEKAVEIWRSSNEEERILLVEDFFKEAGHFEKTTLFISKGKPRPEHDKYACRGIPSDPVYALYAEKKGGDPRRKARPSITLTYGSRLTEEELEERKKRIKATLMCPHCGEKLKKWAVPDNPFEVTWDNEFMYICFNDHCPYYVRGWDHMSKEGNRGVSYRLMYNPEKDVCMPIPVPSPRALRESIVE